jgi:hypothetical protein
MGSFLRKVQQLGHKIDPLDRAVSGAVGLDFKDKPVPPVPKAPNIDTATQSLLDTQDQLSRRKGILGNVFAGNQTQTASVGKTTLGG